MNSIFPILKKSIVLPYYRQHAGLFLFLFFLFFGIQPSLHDALLLQYSIMLSILSSPLFLMIAVSLWLLYTFKTIHFFFSCIKKDAYHFIFQLLSIHAKLRLLLLAAIQMLLLLPVWLYGLITLVIAIMENQALQGIAVLAIILTLGIASTLFLNYLLRKGTQFSLLPGWMRIKWPSTFSFILLRYVFSNQFTALLITKTFSFFGLYGLSKIDANYFDGRVLWLFYISSLAGHCVLIYKNHQFAETKLSFYRNLPVRSFRTISSLLFVYVIVLIPEFWALKGIAVYQHDVTGFGWMLLTGPSILLLLHCFLYTEDFSMEGFLQLVFGTWIVLIFFSLSSWKWLMPVIATGMAIFLFTSNYFNYEKKATVEKLE